jgi:RNA polymerase sigma-70 factor (ECF subfamily)
MVDGRLVERAARGDRDAYEALAREIARGLYLTAHRIVRDADDADDAAQQALISIWRELPSLRDPDRFEAWSYRIVVRHCFEADRRRRRLGVLEINAADDHPDQLDRVAGADLRDELGRALGALSTDHRIVLVLHHYVGMPLTEIAEILGIPYGTVGSRLHHATRAMQAALEAGDRSTLFGGQTA